MVSEVNSDEPKFVLPVKKFEPQSNRTLKPKVLINCFYLGETNRVRWNPIPGDPTVYVKYDFWKLNILDVEKKALTLTEDVLIDSLWRTKYDIIHS